MHFYTFFVTTATLALVNATPAMMRRYGNETTTEMSTATNSDALTSVSMSTILPSNSTSGPGVSASITESVITTIDSTTLTYTLGPSGSSSVVTTVVESTSTITMTSTMYITLTKTEEPTGTIEPTSGGYGDEPTSTDPSVEPTATDPGDDPIFTDPGTEPTGNGTGDGPTAADPSDLPSETDPSTYPSATPGYGNDPIVTTLDGESTATGEATVTVTDYLTTTETITMQAIETGFSENAATDDGSNHAAGSDPGALFQSSILFGGQDGACGVTTVTATIVEMSTVTVTPTGTDNYPIPPTASPSYGSGNGTDPFPGYPTASSGFLTLYKRARPTRL